MARNTGPVCKICKSQGEKLFLKGERCFTPKCAVDKTRDRSNRGVGAGGGNTRRRTRVSEHGLQLQQKQKGRHIYGLFERQFRKTFDRAAREPGVTGQNLMKLLERRLDNVVYRSGFTTSRPQARQTVNHGHIEVNGRKVDIPSFIVKVGDVVSWRENSKSKFVFERATQGVTRRRRQATWITVDPSEVTATITSMPSDEDVDSSVDTRQIVEYYSRR